MKTALCAASAGISGERQQLAKRIHRKVREFIRQDLPPVAELRAIGPSVRASHRSTFQDRRVTMKCSLANALAVTVMLLLSISCLSQQNCQFQFDAGQACPNECPLHSMGASWSFTCNGCYDNVILDCGCGNQSYGTTQLSSSRVCYANDGINCMCLNFGAKMAPGETPFKRLLSIKMTVPACRRTVTRSPKSLFQRVTVR